MLDGGQVEQELSPRAPMGQAVIGGVITSSLLTLVVVPVVYCYMDDLANALGRLWRRRDPKSAAVTGVADTDR